MCGDDLHVKMDRNEKQEIEVLEGTSFFLKIPIHGKIPPLRLTLEYESSSGIASSKGDLKVCISRKNKQPSFGACDKMFSKPLQV